MWTCTPSANHWGGGWNHPVQLPGHGAAVDVCERHRHGNAFILKPSEKDPSASLFLAQLWRDAGLPDGVFTVVQGTKTPSIPSSSTRHRGGELRGSTPLPATCTPRPLQTANGRRLWAEPRITWWSCRRRRRRGSRLCGFRGVRAAGERCMAVSVVVAVGDVGDRLVERSPRDWAS